jgi:hypothetical protein
MDIGFRKKICSNNKRGARLARFIGRRIIKLFPTFTENLRDGTFPRAAAFIQASSQSKWRMKMTRLVTLSFALAVLALPAQAQAQKGSTNINGNVFDAPRAEQGYAGPSASGSAAPDATMPRTAAPRHVRKHQAPHSAQH